MEETSAVAEWIREVVGFYEERLCRYAYGITRDQELARDAVQETFLRLCEQDPRAIQDYLSAWLFFVCRSRAIDRLRKEKKMTVTADMPDLAAEADADPAYQVERGEEASRLQEAMKNLPPNQREALALKFQEGLSYREISMVMQTSPGNVGYLLHEGIRRLREITSG